LHLQTAALPCPSSDPTSKTSFLSQNCNAKTRIFAFTASDKDSNNRYPVNLFMQAKRPFRFSAFRHAKRTVPRREGLIIGRRFSAGYGRFPNRPRPGGPG